MVLLSLIGAEAWLFGNICANAELVKSVEPRRKTVSTPTIEGSGIRADNLILHRTNSISVGPPLADNFLILIHQFNTLYDLLPSREEHERELLLSQPKLIESPPFRISIQTMRSIFRRYTNRQNWFEERKKPQSWTMKIKDIRTL